MMDMCNYYLLVVTYWMLLPMVAASSEYVPQNLTVSERKLTDDVCVTLIWSPPADTPTELSYVVQYDNSGWQSVDTQLSSEKCGLSPYQLLEYEVRVTNGTKSISGEYRTACSAPTPPRFLNIEEPVKYNCSGRWRWKYRINWLSPATINCDEITSYNTRYIHGIQAPDAVNLTYYSFRRWVCADGNVPVQFYISAVNNANEESPAAFLNLTTPILLPQSGPRSVDLSTNSTSCVTLSWEPPQYPNAPSIYYQYLFTNYYTWMNFTTPKENRHTFCGFLPNEEIYYHIRAANNNGKGPQTRSSTIRTLFAEVEEGTLAVNLTSENTTCVILSWDLRKDILSPFTGYQYKCNEAVYWNNITGSTARSQLICGFVPYQRVQCSMRARRVEGFSSITTPDVTRTRCKAPSWANFIRFNDKTKEMVHVDGKPKWKYTITWRKPTDINCESLEAYVTWHPTKYANMVVSNSSQRVIYVDEGLLTTVYIVVRNNEGYETPVFEADLYTPLFDPGNVIVKSVNLAADNSTCATLSWGPPDFPNGTDAGYQYKCNDDVTWSNVAIPANQKQICGFSHFDMVQCEMRALRDGDYTEVMKSPRARIPCEAPSNPRNLSQGRPELVFNSGRLRWKYTITWQAPAEINCDSVQSYNAYTDQNYVTHTILRQITRTQYILYTDGTETFKFSVGVYNNQFNTSYYPAVKTTSPILAPQDGPASVTVLARNSSCVVLKWVEPNYINALRYKVLYQYKCNIVVTSWTNITLADWRKYRHAVYQCGFKPYQEMQCSVRVSNRAGIGPATTSNVNRTRCAAPSQPLSLEFGIPTLVMNSSTPIWKYPVSWKEPLIANCGNITEYWTRYPNETSPVQVVSLGTSRYVYVKPDAVVFFFVLARNEKGISSQPAFTTIRSPAIGSLRPLHLNLRADNSSCITLSWSKAVYPGAAVTDYKYKCNSTDTWTSMIMSLVDSGLQQICGLSPYQSIYCEMRASTNTGHNFSALSPTIRTLCSVPSSPKRLNFDLRSQARMWSSGRIRWRFRVTWLEPDVRNCQSIQSYVIGWSTERTIIIPAGANPLNTRYVYLDGEQRLTVRVAAKNNAGFISKFASTSVNSRPLSEYSLIGYQCLAISGY